MDEQTRKQKKAESDKKYYQKNKEKLLEKAKEYQKNHKEKHNESSRKYRANNKKKIAEYTSKYFEEHKEILSEKSKIYYKNNREKCLNARVKYIQDRRKTDTSFKIRDVVSTSIRQALNGLKGGKSIFKYLPYTIEELKNHLEKQFEAWMTWQNWGRHNIDTYNENDPETWVWNIDHIIPQSFLPYTSMEDENFKKCWALDNLRPLEAVTNIKKGNSV